MTLFFCVALRVVLFEFPITILFNDTQQHKIIDDIIVHPQFTLFYFIFYFILCTAAIE
jgi:hypothetical protein